MKSTFLKIFIGFLSFLFVALGSLSAQQDTYVSGLANRFTARESINTFDLREKTTEGTIYFNDNWYIATVFFRNGEIYDFPAIYDLKQQVLEVNIDKSIRIVPHTVIDKFILSNDDSVETPNPNRTTFYDVNSYFAKQDKPLKKFYAGFYQLIEDGEYSLWKRYDSRLRKANYNEALAVGDLNDQIYKVEEYYLCNGTMMVQIISSKKKALEAISKLSGRASSIAAKEKTKFGKEESLVELVKVLNSSL